MIVFGQTFTPAQFTENLHTKTNRITHVFSWPAKVGTAKVLKPVINQEHCPGEGWIPALLRITDDMLSLNHLIPLGQPPVHHTQKFRIDPGIGIEDHDSFAPIFSKNFLEKPWECSSFAGPGAIVALIYAGTCMPGSLRGVIRTMIGEYIDWKEVWRIVDGLQTVYSGSDNVDFIVGWNYDHEPGWGNARVGIGCGCWADCPKSQK